MLKKAGIVVAGSAAALLALSPLAFAGESHHRGHDHGPKVYYHSDDQFNSVGGKTTSANGLVAINDVNALNNLNVCPTVTAPVGLGTVLGLLSQNRTDVGAEGGDATCVNDNSISQGNFRH